MTKQEYTLQLEQNQRRNEVMSQKYANGVSVHELAKEYNLTVTYVRSILVRTGSYQSKNRRSKAEMEDVSEIFTFKELRNKITRSFPVGKVFRIEEYKILYNTKVFVRYKYFVVKKHYSYCIQLSEVIREETENGFKYTEKGRYGQASPSYADLYLMLRNGVKVNE